MTKKTKKLPVFYAVYLTCILLFVLALAFGMGFVRDLLAEFESVQPKYKAQEVFEEYFADFDYKTMTDYYSVSAFLTESGYQTEEDLFSALDAVTKDGKVTYYRSSSGIADVEEYAVAVNKTRVATFTLKKTGEKSENGFDLYELDTIKIYNPVRLEVVTNDQTNPPTYLYTYRITAPLSHKITADGKELTEAERVGQITYDKSAMANAKNGFEGIPMVSYEIIASAPPALTATDANGDVATAAFDEKTSTFSYEVVFNKSVENDLGAHALTVAQKIGIYMQAGDKFSSIQDYIDPTAPLYEQLEDIGGDSWMVKKFDSCEFKNEKIAECYRYSDTEVSLRVSLTQIGHRSGYEDSIDTLDYTFCFRLVDGEWLLYESYNN